METVQALFDIVRKLRGKGGCEWDQKQTPQTMFKCLEEEVYELEEAITREDILNIREELGDVLFQLVFIAQIFQEQKLFAFSDVVDSVAEKMIRRHPHVYGDAEVSSHAQLIDQWEAIKARENKENGREKKSALDRVPKGLPAMGRALKVSKCAVKEGFDWDNIHQVIDTVRSEMDEFEAALGENDPAESMMEFGDIMFSLVNVARFAKFHPETALSSSTAKFEGRFRTMEQKLKEEKVLLKDLSRPQKDRFWEQAKAAYDK